LTTSDRGCHSHSTNYTGFRFGAIEAESDVDSLRPPLSRVPDAVCQLKLVSMKTARNQASSGWSFWRRLVTAAAIYALVVQPLLLAIAGTQLAQASALDDVSLSQLCLHQADGSPAAPADQQQKHSADSHCLLCFAGAFHLLGVPDPTAVSLFGAEMRRLRQSERPFGLTASSRYSLACPRGPPLDA
jgi:hypothetical protein